MSTFFCNLTKQTNFTIEKIMHGKNNFAERSKILLDTDLKIILLDHQSNFVGTLRIMSNAVKKC